MGEAAEEMAARNGITREAQDAFTVRSHHRAAAAIQEGLFDDEITSVNTGRGEIYADSLVRAETSVEALARLRPVFAKDGTVTAGNASPLTDGAAAVLLMSEEKAKALGYTPKAAFRSWAVMVRVTDAVPPMANRDAGHALHAAARGGAAHQGNIAFCRQARRLGRPHAQAHAGHLPVDERGARDTAAGQLRGVYAEVGGRAPQAARSWTKGGAGRRAAA